MSYTWTTSISQYQSSSTAASINETRTNLDTERAARGLGAYSYTQTISQYTIQIKAIDFTEMKTAADAAYDANNYCPSHNEHNTGNYASNNAYYSCSVYYATYYYKCSSFTSYSCPSNYTAIYSQCTSYCAPN